MSGTAKRTGRQSPTRSYILPYTDSRGPHAIDRYETGGTTALPWQRDLTDQIMAVDADGLWVHQKFGFAVPRRNGKNELVVIREIDGLERGEQILHTAHRTSTSHSAWTRLCKKLEDMGYVELGRKRAGEKDPENGYRCSKQYGLESIVIPATGGMACFRTRTSSGGLGEGYDLLVIDEAQEYTTAQETALVYVVSASQNPQTIFCGTPPTLVSAGTVFSNLRRDTLAGESYDTGWAEWSIDHDPEDITDPDLWYEANPSLGYHLSERAVRSEIRGDKLDFVIQRLGYWYQYSIKSEISRADWTALKCSDPPELTGKLYVGVKFGVDGKNSAVSLAVRTADGRIFVESLDCRPQRAGVDWITLMLSCMDIADIVIDGKSGQSLLAQSLETEDLPAPILPTTAEVIEANATFTAALSAGEICHMGQPSLEEVACNTERRSIGTAGGYGYKSIKIDLDIALLDSVILAVWACSQDQSEPGDVFVVY